MLDPRNIYNAAPPERRSREQNNPTLLFSWWCTGTALAIIATRLVGRMVRNNKLFREDWIMMMSVVPLAIRMGLVHVILIFGTNNADTEGMMEREIHLRSIGARLVLASRIFYALFIWMAKFTVSEFLKRMTSRFWKRRHQIGLQSIRIFIVVSFFVVVIATLAECQPFSHYWQVVPDPGPRCRQGYAQLITMGVCDMITDILLVVWPIPIVWKSSMPLKRKVSLILLFSLSIVLLGIAAYRVPSVIEHRGRQQYRTVWASGEILAAAAVSNAVVIGSFLRDRGVKKQKYKFGSQNDSIDRHSSRRPTLTQQQWGSDEDLIRDMGYRLDPELHCSPSLPRPAPVATPTEIERQPPFANKGWQFGSAAGDSSRASADSMMKAGEVEDPFPSPKATMHPPPIKKNVSFFDMGGLLEDGSRRTSSTLAPSSSSTSTQDFAALRRPSRTQALLGDLGGLLSPVRVANREQTITEGISMLELPPRGSSSRQNSGDAPIGVPSPKLDRQDSPQSLQDVGGLLEDPAVPPRPIQEPSHRENSPRPTPSNPAAPSQNSSFPFAAPPTFRTPSYDQQTPYLTPPEYPDDHPTRLQ